jgi:hypothetical protein
MEMILRWTTGQFTWINNSVHLSREEDDDQLNVAHSIPYRQDETISN